MATNTVRWSSHVNSGRMTVLTAKNAVTASQRESAQRVLKIRDLPELLTVTVLARDECALMKIIFLVTDNTIVTSATKTFVVNMTILTWQRIMDTC